jgi:hypothetical protein
MMLPMTHSLTPSKLLLVADRRESTARPSPVAVRRFRLARLKLDAAAPTPAVRLSGFPRVND